MEDLFESKRPEYPWQMELPPWTPKAKMTEAERRADEARFHFDFWKGLLGEGLFDHQDLFYDEGHGFFRFSDGTFPLTHARELMGAKGDGVLPRIRDVSVTLPPGTIPRSSGPAAFYATERGSA